MRLVIDANMEEGGIGANDGEVFSLADWILTMVIAEADGDHTQDGILWIVV